MQRQSGWGDKTSALFVKTIYHLHNGQYSKELKIWNDVPIIISNNDKFFLPVDAVIIKIFRELDNTINWNFKNVNAKLKSKYTEQDIEIWDDLWFWGFVTQNGSGNDRILEWNENKYWTLKDSDKNDKMINEIKQKSEEFLSILRKGK